MNEEQYTLYKSDKDFKEYVDKYCQKHNVNIFEAFGHNMLREYGKWLREVKK